MVIADDDDEGPVSAGSGGASAGARASARPDGGNERVEDSVEEGARAEEEDMSLNF